MSAPIGLDSGFHDSRFDSIATAFADRWGGSVDHVSTEVVE